MNILSDKVLCMLLYITTLKCTGTPGSGMFNVCRDSNNSLHWLSCNTNENSKFHIQMFHYIYYKMLNHFNQSHIYIINVFPFTFD